MLNTPLLSACRLLQLRNYPPYLVATLQVLLVLTDTDPRNVVVPGNRPLWQAGVDFRPVDSPEGGESAHVGIAFDLQ